MRLRGLRCMHEAGTQPTRRWYHLIVGVLSAPFWIPILVVVFAVLGVMVGPCMISGYFQHRRWKRDLRRGGRVKRWEDLVETEVAGTLIVDRCTLGWNTTYCWWTSDDVEEQSPIPTPTDDERRRVIQAGETLVHPFDQWCWQRYLALETGTAYLLATRHGDRLANRLQSAMPGAKVVAIWSAPSSLEHDRAVKNEAAG